MNNHKKFCYVLLCAFSLQAVVPAHASTWSNASSFFSKKSVIATAAALLACCGVFAAWRIFKKSKSAPVLPAVRIQPQPVVVDLEAGLGDFIEPEPVVHLVQPVMNNPARLQPVVQAELEQVVVLAVNNPVSSVAVIQQPTRSVAQSALDAVAAGAQSAVNVAVSLAGAAHERLTRVPSPAFERLNAEMAQLVEKRKTLVIIKERLVQPPRSTDDTREIAAQFSALGIDTQLEKLGQDLAALGQHNKPGAVQEHEAIIQEVSRLHADVKEQLDSFACITPRAYSKNLSSDREHKEAYEYKAPAVPAYVGGKRPFVMNGDIDL